MATRFHFRCFYGLFVMYFWWCNYSAIPSYQTPYFSNLLTARTKNRLLRVRFPQSNTAILAPISQTNFCFPWRYHKSGHYCISWAAVSNIQFSRRQTMGVICLVRTDGPDGKVQMMQVCFICNNTFDWSNFMHYFC